MTHLGIRRRQDTFGKQIDWLGVERTIFSEAASDVISLSTVSDGVKARFKRHVRV
jgi:hypothetical protein